MLCEASVGPCTVFQVVRGMCEIEQVKQNMFHLLIGVRTGTLYHRISRVLAVVEDVHRNHDLDL